MDGLSLSCFEELYKTLEEKGEVLSTLEAPLWKVMMYNIETDTTLGAEDVDLNAQRRVFTSDPAVEAVREDKRCSCCGRGKTRSTAEGERRARARRKFIQQHGLPFRFWKKRSPRRCPKPEISKEENGQEIRRAVERMKAEADPLAA